MEQFHKHPIGMKTHHDEVFSSVIDIVEGRMIDTNTLIENERKEGRGKLRMIVIVIENELIEFGI